MAQTKAKKDTVKIIGKCIQCGKKQELTSQQILDAEKDGAAISTCCMFPMTIEKVSVKFAK